MKTFKIHLIRHGLTDANLLGLYIGNRTDLPLNPEGLAELKELSEKIEYPKIERLYSSPMMRAKQTGAVLFPNMNIKVIDELTEFDFGAFEGKNGNELQDNKEYKDWISGKTDAVLEGESTTDFIKRLALGLNMIVRDMMESDISEAGVIMHGGAIMMLLAATAVPRQSAAMWTSEPGRGYSVRITPSLYHSSGIIEVYDVV
jgi:alpha-ribazole phosphatase